MSGASVCCAAVTSPFSRAAFVWLIHRTMNAPTPLNQLVAAATEDAPRLREIPYNYT